jgi:hypothetical protein
MKMSILVIVDLMAAARSMGCHPERSEAESKDPADITEDLQRDSSTSLGMTAF